MDLHHFDIIFGMKWLYAYGAKINCKDLEIILCVEKSQEVYLYGLRKENPYPLISILSIRKLLC